MDILQYIFSTFFQRNMCNLTAEAAPHLVQFLFDFKSRKSLVIRSGLPSLNRCFPIDVSQNYCLIAVSLSTIMG